MRTADTVDESETSIRGMANDEDNGKLKSPLAIYLHAINQIPLLNREEEQSFTKHRNRAREMMQGPFADIIASAWDRHLTGKKSRMHRDANPFFKAFEAVRDAVINEYEHGDARIEGNNAPSATQALAFFIDEAKRGSTAKDNPAKKATSAQMLRELSVSGLDDGPLVMIPQTCANVLRYITPINQTISTRQSPVVGSLSFLAQLSAQKCIEALKSMGDDKALKRIRSLEEKLSWEMRNDESIAEHMEQGMASGRIESIDLWTPRRIIIESNLRLVVSIARTFQGRGLPLQDLIEEGNMGLLRGAEGFECGYGRISTYLTNWIKQSIQRALQNQVLTIRIPAYLYDDQSKYWKIFNDMTSKNNGAEPSFSDVCAVMGLSKTGRSALKDGLKAASGAKQESQARTDGEKNLMDNLVSDPNVEEADHDMTLRDELEHMFEKMDQLKPLEAEVLRMRFGLGEYAHCLAENSASKKYPGMTLEKIGEKIGLSKERARQIQDDALEHLRFYMEKSRTSAVAVVNGNGATH